MTVVVRDATEADLPGVAAIYTHFVLETTITFNTSVVTPRAWTERFANEIDGGPHELLVAEVDGHVAGYAVTGTFRPKPAYRHSVEVTIYVAPDQVDNRLGTQLYEELMRRLDANPDVHRAYALVALPNDRSIAFHEKFGFVHRGTLTECGYKFDRWLDVSFFERACDG
ncbi:MAG: GNAT family N-acetyltransferase [Nitriliruptorales bacterium]|nr:GNAT family N-acetyltransferase [Nitriliruptorales bacterium]